MELIIATHNQHKLEEFKSLISSKIQLLSLSDIGFEKEIEETGNSFVENAEIKAEAIYKKTKKNVFADDSGLVIEALNGAPGVKSSRYAGTGNSEDNMQKVLSEMKDSENRKAYFKAVFCLIIEGQKFFFEGESYGIITKEKRGNSGFGYDPIFIPNGYSQTFAEISSEEKNKISHRGKAVRKLINFLEKY